ncbi:hypothetical protein DSM106972_087700 [Dulcicalothrix desertica PCC 7102]|uniref:Uncharacterized protein n=2 Tax=Dulcicalothrix desertica TaxID=32056 RepID=A0A433UQV5_9CYAN|nr:hypothetical protein DSM106972_087700 [Dulcicalothrix desertica PCC 7102]
MSFSALAKEHKPQSKMIQASSSSPIDTFYTATSKLVQEQINLIARIENAMNVKDPNRVRAVRGQILIQAASIEGFVKRLDPNYKNICASELNSKEARIFCPLYASSQELLKLSPLLDRILSRRGESAMVRSLPLVSGERQSDPVMPMSPISRPDLGRIATPHATQEPNLFNLAPQLVIGSSTKKLVANYTQPIQGAIKIPQEAIKVLEAAQKHIEQAQLEFGQEAKFHNPKQTAIALDRFAYDLDPQESQTYSKFLALPQTGIFRVLPHTVYHRPLNTLQNRLSKTVIERYPFPSLAEKDGFTPNFALSLVGNNFHVLASGVDYSLMANLGNIPIEKLDANLENVNPLAKAFFTYQPPRQLNLLQQERRRLATNKQNNSGLLSSVPAQLNNTYLVRSFQFKLPSAIVSGKKLTPQERLSIDELLKISSSDTIVAFRPVRQRSDGSYTVLWRVLNRFTAPQIEDLEAYLKY